MDKWQDADLIVKQKMRCVFASLHSFPYIYTYTHTHTHQLDFNEEKKEHNVNSLVN